MTIAQAEPIKNPLLPYNPDTGGSGADFFSSLIGSLVKFGFILATIIFLFMLLWGAIQWIMSGGDKGAVQAAQGKITNAIIGLVVLFSIFAILSLIGTFFDVEIFKSFTIDLSEIKLSP